MSTQSNKSNFITAPVAGVISPLAVTTTASSQDLASCGNQTVNMASGTNKVGLVGSYVTFYADGGDVGVLFGASSASVTGGNVPVLTAQGANATGGCIRIANGSEKSYLITAATRFIGMVGSATCTLRIVASSP